MISSLLFQQCLNPCPGCAIENCGSGFVFVSWLSTLGGHSTAFYFDKEYKQVFIDPAGPAGMLRVVDENQINVVQYLSENHFWLGKDEAVGKIAIVDFEIRKTRILNQTEFLQSLFHAPMKEENVTQWTDLKGCCTTVILLVVWLCLRMGSGLVF